MSDAPVRVAVAGVGYLGSRHARRLAANPRFDLRWVTDLDGDRAGALAGELGCRATVDPAEAFPDVEGVVVSTSTGSHRAVAEAALGAGRHVLVEKPLTGRVDDAERLVALAAEVDRVLHVGHVERFNPAVRPLLGELPPPRFVESHRLAPLVPRSLDIDVVQDLMIHDIDLTLAFVGQEPVAVEASGVPVLSGRVDIANARLRFADGTTANLTASRVSLERTRKFRMFCRGVYVSADCAARRADVYRLREDREGVLAEVVRSGSPLDMLRVLDHRTVGPDGPDALDAEHDAFADAMRGIPGGVTGRETLGVLRVMVAVEEAIRLSGTV